MSSYHEERIFDAATKLKAAIQRSTLASHEAELFDSLDDFISAKIEEAKDDLLDRIEKRGIYDPEW